MTDFWSTNLHIPVGHGRAWVWRFDYDRHHPHPRPGPLRGPPGGVLAAPGDALLPRQLQVGEGQAQREPGPRAARAAHRRRRRRLSTEAMVKASAVLLSGYTADWARELRAALRHRAEAHHRLRSGCSTSPTPTPAPTARPRPPAYLAHLAHHPATARNLARKLATCFVSRRAHRRAPRRRWLAAYLEQRHRHQAPILARAGRPPGVPRLRAGQKVRTPVADLVATDPRPGASTCKEPTRWAAAGRAIHASLHPRGCTLFSWPRPDGPRWSPRPRPRSRGPFRSSGGPPEATVLEFIAPRRLTFTLQRAWLSSGDPVDAYMITCGPGSARRRRPAPAGASPSQPKLGIVDRLDDRRGRARPRRLAVPPPGVGAARRPWHMINLEVDEPGDVGLQPGGRERPVRGVAARLDRRVSPGVRCWPARAMLGGAMAVS